jgi:6-pyruvoyltetrahydropterin/6-carboxytetrahydropterin synthase
MRITRRFDFDAGHRIPSHGSECRHLHGHRYAIEVTVSGEIIAAPGDVEQGMVADFGQIKALIKRHVVDEWDHAFLAYAADEPVLAFLRSIAGHKTVIFDAPPTAECLAAKAFGILNGAIRQEYGGRVRLEQVRIYETPNCWADAVSEAFGG